MIDKKELRLPDISEAGQQALELLSDDMIEITGLADFLGKDIVIAAAILKYVNSPVHRRKVEINSVKTAVPLLGYKTCKMIVGLTILQTYKSTSSSLSEKIWAHCINVSTIARLLAEKIYPDLRDDIETTAFMHDMGILVLASSFPDSYPKMYEDCIHNKTPLDKSELEIYGLSHDDVIEFLSPLLRLPSITTHTIKKFHSSQTLLNISSVEDKHLLICHFAHNIVHKYEHYVLGHQGVDEVLAHDYEVLGTLLGLTDHQINDLVEDSEMILNIL